MNDCLGLAPYLPGLRVIFSSIVTDLVLIYESVISFTNDERRLRSDWILFYESMKTHSINYVSSLYNSGANRTESFPAVHVIACLSIAAETRVSFVVTLWFLQAYPLPRKRVLARRCLAMDYSGFQGSCHNTIRLGHVSLEKQRLLFGRPLLITDANKDMYPLRRHFRF
jgi:hypothetical protein